MRILSRLKGVNGVLEGQGILFKERKIKWRKLIEWKATGYNMEAGMETGAMGFRVHIGGKKELGRIWKLFAQWFVAQSIALFPTIATSELRIIV